MHYFIHYIEKLKLCWPLMSECNLSQYIHSPSLLYRLVDHSKVLILLWSTFICFIYTATDEYYELTLSNKEIW